LTVPLPTPLFPSLIVIHATLLVAVQTQPFGAVTATSPGPPLPKTVWLVGEIAKVQAAAASWLTVNGCPAMVMVTLRAMPELGATV
jgi:hypothetical protein